MIRVVLADDHAIVRQGLRVLLEVDQAYHVVGEAADGLKALALIDEHRPDVAILDLQMPDLGGLEVARRAREQSPRTRIIILSMYDVEPYVLHALRVGVVGYVMKGAATSDLLAALQAVMAGGRFLSAPLAERALEAYAHYATQTVGPVDRYEVLTNREREVLQMVAQGLSYQDIGERLSISPRTAESHRGNVFRKLGLKDQSELAQYAQGRGLLPEP